MRDKERVAPATQDVNKRGSLSKKNSSQKNKIFTPSGTGIGRDEFIKLPTEEIRQILSPGKRPTVGIFVPDGTRRLTLSFTKTLPGSAGFFSEYLRLTSQYFMNNVDVFFSHGLPTLFVPLIGSHIFNKSKSPQHKALRKILEIIFKSKQWVEFYKKNNIRVKVYGNLKYLEKDDYSPALEWIENMIRITSKNKSHTLFYGFASENETGPEFMEYAINFYKNTGRRPTYSELLTSYYGEYLPPAHFFIMSTKFTGLGSLPPFITNRETRMYFLPAPGILALTRETYRKILYDLLFCQPEKSRREYEKNDLKYAGPLKTYFSNNRSTVFGLSEKIGNFRVLTVDSEENFKKKDE